MGLKDFKGRAGRLGAAVGLMTTVSGVPMPSQQLPNVIKNHQKYSRVMVEEQARKIRRETTKTYNPTTGLDKRTSKKLRKP
ncbi:hypothetical protein BKA23_3400 [Rudaeicoccus suwonensis]|uniref:Uncharacterized protein n=2 Tax=Rudaeicoccus suwonensis TaxID=657409 RepID=A0A561DVJ9_9MICO|nr:hypothetical protein BKA23_3400 [Rudaeicoccus suwonensis]